MEYIANYYIGRDFTPGEILPDDVPAEQIERLLKAGAIRQVSPEPEAYDVPEAGMPGEENPDNGVTDEDYEVPEIDAMAGIVKSEPEKPAASGGRKAKGGRRR